MVLKKKKTLILSIISYADIIVRLRMTWNWKYFTIELSKRLNNIVIHFVIIK